MIDSVIDWLKSYPLVVKYCLEESRTQTFSYIYISLYPIIMIKSLREKPYDWPLKEGARACSFPARVMNKWFVLILVADSLPLRTLSRRIFQCSQIHVKNKFLCIFCIFNLKKHVLKIRFRVRLCMRNILTSHNILLKKVMF